MRNHEAVYMLADAGPPKVPGAFAQTASPKLGGSIFLHIFNAT